MSLGWGSTWDKEVPPARGIVAVEVRLIGVGNAEVPRLRSGRGSMRISHSTMIADPIAAVKTRNAALSQHLENGCGVAEELLAVGQPHGGGQKTHHSDGLDRSSQLAHTQSRRHSGQGNLNPLPSRFRRFSWPGVEVGSRQRDSMGRRAARCVGLLAQRAALADSASVATDNPRHREQLARSLSYLGCSTSLPAGRSSGLRDVVAMRFPGPAAVLSRGKALAARQEVDTAPGLVFRMQGTPQISVGINGAVSMVCDDGPAPSFFQNKDGHRLEDGRYAAFSAEITSFIPAERQYDDPVRTFAYGTDASFYRLNPKLVVKVCSARRLV